MGYLLPVKSKTYAALESSIKKRKDLQAAQVELEQQRRNRFIQGPYGQDVPTQPTYTSPIDIPTGLPLGPLVSRETDPRPFGRGPYKPTREFASWGNPRAFNEADPAFVKRPAANSFANLRITNPLEYDRLQEERVKTAGEYLDFGNLAGNKYAERLGVEVVPEGNVPRDGQHGVEIRLPWAVAQDPVSLEAIAENNPNAIIHTKDGPFEEVGFKGTMAGLGKGFLIGMDIVSGLVLDPAAETLFEATHKAPWDYTIFKDGYFATTEKFRSRGLIAQIAIGIVFDPFLIGKFLKIPVGLTRLAARKYVERAVRELAPELSDDEKERVIGLTLDQALIDGYTVDPENFRVFDATQNMWVDPEDYLKTHGSMEGAVPFVGGGSVDFPTSPAARKRAQELNIDLNKIPEGSGQGGRIVLADVEAYAARQTEIPEEIVSEGEEVLNAMPKELEVSMDQAAQLDGMGGHAADSMPLPHATATAGAAEGAADTAAFEAAMGGTLNDVHKYLFQGPELPVESFRTRVRKGWEKWQELTTDRMAATNAASRRARVHILEMINRGLVRAGKPTWSHLPIQYDAELAMSTAFGAMREGEQGYRLVFDKITGPEGLGNVAVDVGGNNLPVETLDDILALQHNMEVVKMQNSKVVPSAQGNLEFVVPDADAGARLFEGSREGIQGLTWSQMNRMLAKIRMDLTVYETFPSGLPSATVLDDSKWQRYLKASRIVRDHYAELRQKKADAGLISQELSDELGKKYPYYSPIKYIEGTITRIVNATNAGRARMAGVTENSLQELTNAGIHNAEQMQPLMVLPQVTLDTYTLIARNRVADALINVLSFDELNAQYIRRVVRGVDESKVLAHEINGDKIQVARQGFSRIGRYSGGVLEVWEVPTVYAENLSRLADFDMNIAERVMRMINRPMRMVFTSHNPVFMAANFLHDSMVVMMNEGVLPWEIATSLGASFRNIWKQDEFLQKWVAAGGDVSGLSGKMDEDIYREALGYGKSAIDVGSPNLSFREFPSFRHWRSWATSPFRGLNQISRAIEVAPRRAVFKKELARLGDPEGTTDRVRRAAFLSRRATVDFQRYGTAIKMFDAAFLYTNAAIQGTLLPFRAVGRGGWRGVPPGVSMFSKEGAKHLRHQHARLGMIGFMGIAAGVYAHNSRFESYKNMSLQDKITRFSIIMDEAPDQNGVMVPRSLSVQPLLREYSALQAALVYTMDKLFERDAATAEQYLTALMPQLNPAGTVVNYGGRDASFGVQTLPTVTAPGQIFNELIRNHDSFRNAPIISEQMAALPKEEQYDEYTTDLAKRVGGFLGISPLKMQHMMRLGALQDMFMGVDQIIQTFDPSETDPHIASIAADLEIELENNSILDPERKTEARVRNNFFSTNKISSTERRLVELVLNKRDVGIPLATSLQNRFIRQHGGQMRRTGSVVAAEFTGADPQQTAAAAKLLGGQMDLIYDYQLASDQALDNNEITHTQWREAERTNGQLYQGGLMAALVKYPKAAQVMKDEDLDTVAQITVWATYKKVGATALDMWPDTRSRGSILASIKRGIPMTEIAPGVPDYAQYFRRIEEWEADLSAEDKRLLDLEMASVQTPRQREHEAAMRTLRPYWDIAYDVLETLGPGLPYDVYEAYLEGNDDVRMALKAQYSTLISNVQKIVNRQREVYRRENPSMDAIYVTWGYAEAGRTTEGLLAQTERVQKGMAWLNKNNPGVLR